MKYFDAVLEILINVYLWLCIFFAVFYCVNAAFGAEVKIPQNAFKYREYLIKESRFVWGIEAPSATFAAQIHTESGWNEKAKSPAGAVGLTQFMPKADDWIGNIYTELAEADPYNPYWAINALVLYNKYHFDRIQAVNLANKMAFTLSAYNGGLGWVLRDKQKAKEYGYNPYVYFENVEKINSGRNKNAFRENRNYVDFIKKREKAYMDAGFGNGSF